MRSRQALGFLALTVMLSGGFAASGSAQELAPKKVQVVPVAPEPAAEQPTGVPDGQKPPPEKADAGQTPPEKPKCIADNTEFRAVGKTGAFVIELVNSCEQRFRCKVSAYVVNSHGAKQGNAILTLGPKSKGAAARKSFVLDVKSAFGTANSSRECKAI